MKPLNIGVLEIAEDYQPDWFLSGISALIPLPHHPWKPLPGRVIASAKRNGDMIPLLSVMDGEIWSQYNWEDWFNSILNEDYRQLSRPLYTRLPFHYHFIPIFLRNLYYRIQLKFSNSSTRSGFPNFPIEQGLEAIASIYERHEATRTKSAESKAKSQIILTHDIDTKAGFNWVKDIASLELKYGFKSIWFAVGHSYINYKINYQVLDWLAENQFEIGLHGYNHDNKLIFLPEARIRRRFDRCVPLIERYSMKSFRSPSWFRNSKLFHVLQDYLQYDYSSLDTDILCPGGSGGCLWTKSFRRNKLTHIPTTIPYEAPLFLPHLSSSYSSPGQLLEFWKPKLQWLQNCGGNIVVITHPEPTYSGNPKMLVAYEKLLVYLKSLQHSMS